MLTANDEMKSSRVFLFSLLQSDPLRFAAIISPNAHFTFFSTTTLGVLDVVLYSACLSGVRPVSRCVFFREVLPTGVSWASPDGSCMTRFPGRSSSSRSFASPLRAVYNGRRRDGIMSHGG